jgi:hypothetical protein
MRRIDRVRGALIINPLRPVCELQHGPRAVPDNQSSRRNPAGIGPLEYQQVILVVIFTTFDDDCRLGEVELGVPLPTRTGAGADAVSFVDDRAGQKLSLLNVGHVRS